MISADAKPSIQARKRIHPGAPPACGGGQLVEHEYERKGAITYFDAWDVRCGRVEIYHSIIQRKILDPNDFDDTAAVARALNDFEHRYNDIAKPFEWNFTRDKPAALINRLDQSTQAPPLAVAV